MTQAASIVTKAESAPTGARNLHRPRRAAQWLTILILVLIPLSGLIRFDLATASITMLDRQIWFSDVFIILGLMIALGGLLAAANAVVGSLFCGWVCPQNSVSELANALTVKLLGRKAQMLDLTGEKMQVATRRQSPLNYLLLTIGLLLPAMLFAMIPLLYFYPPGQIATALGLNDAVPTDASFYWIYGVSLAIFLFDIAAVRHTACKHFCVYRVWQNAFKNEQTLRIHYDASRSEDCGSCNYCAEACFVDIDPKRTGGFDGCVACGECINACSELHARSKKLAGPGLLSFAMGDQGNNQGGDRRRSRFSGAIKPLLVAGLGALLFVVGTLGYQSNEFSVSREAEGSDYRISIAHKRYRPADIELQLQGLEPGSFRFDRSRLHFDSVGRAELTLQIDSDLPPGLHRFRVIASSDDGWSNAFTVTHLISGG